MKSIIPWLRRRPMIVEHAAAVLFVAIAAVLTVWLRRTFPSTPSALFFCAVILSAWFGGWGPGMVACLLSTVCFYSLAPPSFAGQNISDMIARLVVFLFASVFISWICYRQRRAEAALQQSNEKLEQRVAERTGELSVANEGLKAEIVERKRAEALLDGQKRVLEMIAANAPLAESLAALVRLVEEQVPGMLGSILLIDDQGKHLCHGAAPSLPPEYVKAIDGGAIGPAAGSCGTAAWRKESVFVEDIATDPLWKDYRDLALRYGLRACWSTPIFSAQRELLGTFAMYYRQPALPKPEHLRLIEMATHIACIAICRDWSQTALRESEAKLKEAERIGNIGYWERDLIHDRITWSEETCRIWGLPPNYGPLNQAKLQKLIYPDDRPLQLRAFEDALQKCRPYDVEYRILRPDGHVRFVHVRDEIVCDASGRPVRMFGTVQDITELKQAERELSETKSKLEVILDASPLPIVGVDPMGRITSWNKAAEKVLGWTAEEVLGRVCRCVLAEDMEEYLEVVRKAMQGETILGQVGYRRKKGGALLTCSVSFSPQRDERGKPFGATAIIEDITERKQAEELLKAQEQEIRAIVEHSPDPIIRYDRELCRTYVNPAFVKANGVSRERLLGKKVGSSVREGVVKATAAEVEILERSIKTVFETGRPLNFETTWPLPDGRRSYAVHLEPEFDAQGHPVSVLSIARDITRRKQAERDVQESHQLLQQVLATLPVAVAVTNPMGDIILANAASKRIWGDIILDARERWEQSKGFWHDTGERIAPEDWASARALTSGETTLNELIDIESFDGRRKIILNSSAPIRNAEGRIVGAVIINEDVTEQKKSEEKLLQTEAELARVARLTMMGELVASIAHEVNQPLTAVVTSASAAARWLAKSPPNLEEAREAIQHITRDGNRASEVIRRIRALIQKSAPVRQPVNLNELVHETVALAQPELRRKKVSLQLELSPELPPVTADRVQIQQVLLNLIVNALDSLSAVKDRPRKLRIRTERPEPEAVQVVVHDTGLGIKPQQSEHLFQPFYTTKADGLGMGLVISRSIVEAHGGQLLAASNGGPGATFQFSLPIQDGGDL